MMNWNAFEPEGGRRERRDEESGSSHQSTPADASARSSEPQSVNNINVDDDASSASLARQQEEAALVKPTAPSSKAKKDDKIERVFSAKPEVFFKLQKFFQTADRDMGFLLQKPLTDLAGDPAIYFDPPTCKRLFNGSLIGEYMHKVKKETDTLHEKLLDLEDSESRQAATRNWHLIKIELEQLDIQIKQKDVDKLVSAKSDALLTMLLVKLVEYHEKPDRRVVAAEVIRKAEEHRERKRSERLAKLQEEYGGCAAVASTLLIESDMFSQAAAFLKPESTVYGGAISILCRIAFFACLVGQIAGYGSRVEQAPIA